MHAAISGRAPARIVTTALLVCVVLGAGLAPARPVTASTPAGGSGAVAATTACAAADTKIGQVQGTGLSSPAVGTSVTVEGVVVGDYEGSSAATLQGFYLQDTGDDNAATADGIFVFSGNGNDRVSLGQVVQVTGPVSEFGFNSAGGTQTQISATGAGIVESCGTTGTVTPVDLTLPLVSAEALEAYEGMLVRLPQTLYLTEHFQLGRFGQVVLSSGARLAQPTSVTTPGAAANALQAQNSLNRIFVDDASQAQNPDPIVFARGGQPLSASNTLRGGDSVTGAIGVLGQTDATSAPNASTTTDPVRYRLRPVGALGGAISFTAANPRPTGVPAVDGTLKVAALNLLNYFLTLDTGGTPCGPTASLECRGANTATELTRQRDKLLQALRSLDAAILGLVELENTTGVDPLGDLVSGLNGLTAPGAYAAINTGTIGTDAIRVGLIYQPSAVTPVGPFAFLNSTNDPRFRDTLNRPVLAQSFRENASGEIFTIAVAHLKSKGSACNAVGDPDAGDGQGNCNQTRTLAAQALVDWLSATFAEPDYLIVGDLNAYAQEDPVRAVLAGPDDAAGSADDYTNLIERFGGPASYSFAFDGQWGYLDHALASASLAPQVAGAAEWHINADEPNVLDYNTEFKSAGQQTGLYAADPFRVADHDPVVVGLRLGVTRNIKAYLPLVRR